MRELVVTYVTRRHGLKNEHSRESVGLLRTRASSCGTLPQPGELLFAMQVWKRILPPVNALSAHPHPFRLMSHYIKTAQVSSPLSHQSLYPWASAQSHWGLQVSACAQPATWSLPFPVLTPEHSQCCVDVGIPFISGKSRC